LETGINKNLAGWQIPTSLPLSLIFEITLSSYVPLLSAKSILKILTSNIGLVVFRRKSMKKIREVFETFEPWCKENISNYYATYTEEVKKFLIENDFDNNYRTYTVHNICHRYLGKNVSNPWREAIEVTTDLLGTKDWVGFPILGGRLLKQ